MRLPALLDAARFIAVLDAHCHSRRYREQRPAMRRRSPTKDGEGLMRARTV